MGSKIDDITETLVSNNVLLQEYFLSLCRHKETSTKHEWNTSNTQQIDPLQRKDPTYDFETRLIEVLETTDEHVIFSTFINRIILKRNGDPK